MDLNNLLHTLVTKLGSDLHIRVGSVPYFRIAGTLYGTKTAPITLEQMRVILQQILNPEQQETLVHEKEVDAGIEIPQVGRFRINVYYQKGTPAIAFRHIKTTIPPFETLNVPSVILEISLQHRGLILVTGTTGSGKSTLLASMIDHINSERAVNIVTIEDPIEFIHQNKKAAIAQREVGQDTPSYTDALRGAMRQDPDVILMGEIRDHETMLGALTAADTGHLVLSTIHTLNAVETVSRAVSFFEHHQHSQIRLLLSSVLVAVISMRLIPRLDGTGLVPACEIMVNSATVEEFLMDEEKLKMIPDVIAAGNKQYGSQTFDQSLEQLFKDQQIDFTTAMQFASNPSDFELRVMGGISAASDEDEGPGGNDMLDRF